METEHANLILGTAGHIDHGKSTLIKALTGTDPDRLAEEKERGITIELGFAQMDLPDGRTIGVVDVPGHEHFVRQMISGSTGIDIALLVIAADDGIMPQTIEHTVILKTLGVTSCVVALTKADLVDDEWLDYMKHEVRTFMDEHGYPNAPIIATSGATGQGLDELRQAIAQLCDKTHPQEHEGITRLPIDRVFTIKGAGTVVTGTLWSGSLHTDDQVEILPHSTLSRIRSIQINHASVDKAVAGNRVALNLVGVKTNEIHPGDCIALPHTIEVSTRFDAELTYCDTAQSGKPLESGERLHVAHGTREVLGRVLLFDGQQEMKPGETALAQIRLEEPLPVSYRDRFIIRTFSPMHVAGGGKVLLAHPRRRSTLTQNEQKLLNALREHDMQTAVEAALALHDLPVCAHELSHIIPLSDQALTKYLEDAVDHKHAYALRGEQTFYTTQRVLQQQIGLIERTLIAFHANHPEDTGIAQEALRQRCAARASAACFDALVCEAVARGVAVVDNGTVGHPQSQSGAKKAVEEAADTIAPLLDQGAMAPPSVTKLAEMAQINVALVRKALAQLELDNRADRITSELFFSHNVIEQCKQTLQAHFAAGGDGSVASLKNAMGTSRKYAVPVLEYLDAQGFTSRKDDSRVLK
ncbi:MAG: selenocysteine-specific translation elongation factor [Eggerthellaceae bacterium]|jgi:selenocysteine-specific elongation factor|nr:selenocysteine-specific translation elongation factor [Eggerthellaceae bacterium]